MPPPLLLLSQHEDPKRFVGVIQDKSGMSGKALRTEHSHEMKELMNRQKGRWGSQQILNWIESNLESGRSETQNMEKMINHDVNKKYIADNEFYRLKMLKKLGSKDSTKPVFIGGAPSNSARFLLPHVESGQLDQLRSRFHKSLVPPT